MQLIDSMRSVVQTYGDLATVGFANRQDHGVVNDVAYPRLEPDDDPCPSLKIQHVAIALFSAEMLILYHSS